MNGFARISFCSGFRRALLLGVVGALLPVQALAQDVGGDARNAQGVESAEAQQAEARSDAAQGAELQRPRSVEARDAEAHSARDAEIQRQAEAQRAGAESAETQSARSVESAEHGITFWLEGEISPAKHLTPELGLAWLRTSEADQEPSGFRRASEILCLFDETRERALEASVRASDLKPDDLQNWQARIDAHFCNDLSDLEQSLALMDRHFPGRSLYEELSPRLKRWSILQRTKPRQLQQPLRMLDFARLKRSTKWREVAETEAYILHLNGQPQEAMRALGKSDSTHAQWLRHLVMFELKQYMQIAASEACQSSTDHRLLELCVIAMLHTNRNEPALAVLEQLERINPGNHHYLVQKGQVLMRLGRDDESRQVLERAVFAGNVVAIQLLAHIADVQERPDDAADLYLSTPPGPFLLPALYSAVTVLLKNERLPEAARLLTRKSRQLGDDNAKLLALLGDVYLQLHEYRMARNTFRRALKLDPGNTYARVGSYYSMFMLGRRKEALQQAERLVQEFPDAPEVLNNLSYLLSLSGRRLDYARQLAERALEHEPDNAAFYDTLGWVEFRAQNVSKALEHLETAWALEKHTDVGRHLGEVLWHLGRANDARKIWSETAALYPPDPEVERLLEKYVDP